MAGNTLSAYVVSFIICSAISQPPHQFCKPERGAEYINASSLHHYIPVCLWADLKAHKSLRREHFTAARITEYVNAVVVSL